MALAVFAVSMILMYAVKATGTLRVSQEGELEGLDLHEHGAPAYPEFVTVRGQAMTNGSVTNGVETSMPGSGVASAAL